MIVPAHASFSDIDNISDYIVRGAEGEYYGRFNTYPTSIPYAAMVEQDAGRPYMTLGASIAKGTMSRRPAPARHAPPFHASRNPYRKRSVSWHM